MVATNRGVELDRMLRTGACGTWWSASTSAGYPLNLLQLEPSLIALPDARARATAAVAAVRAVRPAGVLRTSELVVEAKRAWLVVATPPAATVADLLAAETLLDPGSAAGIACDVAHALRDLHAFGLGHGDLAPDTVILTSAGWATLVEVGVLGALLGRPTDVGRDAGAWAELTQDLAGIAPATEAGALREAAKTAHSGDLTTAIRQLASAATDLSGFASRDSLVSRLPAAIATAPSAPARRSVVDVIDSGIRLRFGQGVPDSAIVTARARALQLASPPPKRRWLPRVLRLHSA